MCVNVDSVSSASSCVCECRRAVVEVRVLAVHWIRTDILRLQVDTRTVTSVPLHGSAHWRPEGRTHLHISYSAMWFYHSHPGRQRQAIY